MRIVALEPEHILAVQLQPAQAYAMPHINEAQAVEIAMSRGIGWAAVDGDEVLACAGIVHVHDERGLAWAMVSDEALRQFKTIHRVISQVVISAPWRRVEMIVDCDHAAGCRWAERMGFEQEGRMRAYTPDGRDCFLYARVK